MVNIIIIHAIRKTSSLPKTLKTLLLSLAVSDVGVGLMVQPFYITLLVKWLQQNNPGCNIYMAFVSISWSLSQASFWGVVAVSVDRFLAIHLHLRYQELVTHKRVIAVVISIWLLSVFLSLMVLWAQRVVIYVVSILGAFGLVVTTMVYIRIYLAVRRHRNQIQVLQVQQAAQPGEFENVASIIKSAVGIFYVYLVFLVCYLPSVISMAAFQIYGPSVALKKFMLFSWTLMFLNSSLNPLIYCLKMTHIRHVFINILRNMSWYRNLASQ